MVTLGEQLASLIAQHDLTALSVHAHRDPKIGARCTATAHAANGICEISDFDLYDKTPGRAIASAISKVAEERLKRQMVPALVAAELAA